MAEPFLHLRNIRLVWQRIRGSRRPHRMNTQAVDLYIQTGFKSVLFNNVPIDRVRV
jgi:hypothetical protein